MKKISSIFVLIIIIITIASCDNYLSLESPNNLPEDHFWKSLSDVKKGLTAVYANSKNEAIYSVHEGALISDLAWPGLLRPSPKPADAYDYYIHNYNNKTKFIQEKWEACYQGIFRANQVIRALNRLKVNLTADNEDSWRELMAQARFFRGLYHFYLHSAYNKGKIIIIDEIPMTMEDFHRPLSESKDVIDFFRKDLRYAYENLPIEYKDEDKNLGRVTKGTAATILGTSYLYEYSDTHDDNALNAAMDLFHFVIYDCNYELMQNPEYLFNEQYEMNKESIYEIAYSGNIHKELGMWDANGFQQNIGFYTRAWTEGHLLPAWLSNAYEIEPVDTLDPRNKYEQIVINPVDQTQTVKEVYRKVSMRASAMVALWDDIYSPCYLKPSVTEYGGGFNFYQGGFGYYKKYSDCKSYASDQQYCGMNLELNRLAEVYLMYAECFIHKNDIVDALYYINIIRARWGLVLYGPELDKKHTYDCKPYNKETLMDKLMYVDKPLECSLEGHLMRFIDLRRWGILEDRFKQLSKEEFYAVKGSTTLLTGKSMTLGTYGIVKNAAEIKANPQDYVAIDFEYKETAKHFNFDNDAWFPIPSSEIENNPNLYK